MKTICILMLSLLSLSLSAQKSAKLYIKAQKAMDQHDYYEVLDLMDKQPKEEKNTAQYNKYMALALDSLKRYAAAISYYEPYVTQSHDTIAASRLVVVRTIEQQRIAAWQAKLIRIKDCAKCNGRDTVITETSCMNCGGAGQVRRPCSRCRGAGLIACGTCSGKGSLSTQNGPVTCNSCMGSGTKVCSNCDRGYKDESCNGCNGSGRRVLHIKCDLHD